MNNDWLARTIEKYAHEKSDSILPSIVVLAPSHAIAYAELLELALRLESLSHKEGSAQLREVLDKDPRPGQLLHLRLQLEVGALAHNAGQSVAFEVPLKTGFGPADVVVDFEMKSMVVETKAVLLDDPTRAHQDATDRLFEGLRQLELRYNVDCTGEFEETLQQEAADAFLSTAEGAAAAAHELQQPQILHDRGAAVTFSPRVYRSPSRLEGPVHRSLSWHRTRRILRKKAWQSKHYSSVWLRVDVLDGLWQFTPWAQMPLSEKLETLLDPVKEALAPCTHVAGVVVTSGAAHAQGDFFGESFRIEDSYALRRLIDPLRVRETMIIALNSEAAYPAEMWRGLYDEEPEWLENALARTGLPTVDEIFARPPS